MDTLYLMVTITDRKLEKKFLNFYREQGLEVSLTTLGHGTASSEIRDFFGLGGRERSLLFHTVTGKNYERFLPLEAAVPHRSSGFRHRISDSLQQRGRQKDTGVFY